jgi:hypothetical protein
MSIWAIEIRTENDRQPIARRGTQSAFAKDHLYNEKTRAGEIDISWLGRETKLLPSGTLRPDVLPVQTTVTGAKGRRAIEWIPFASMTWRKSPSLRGSIRVLTVAASASCSEN